MTRSAYLLAALLVVTPVQAGGFFLRPTRTSPTERVPELLAVIKNDPDDAKRSEAADELRLYDPRMFPEIHATLVDALRNDPSYSVRAESASSLGRLRPITQTAGRALEQALETDSSTRVRMAARSALWQYFLNGYRTNQKETPVETKEPPLALPSK